MLIKSILVDTNIWHYAYVIPSKEDFQQIHTTSFEFISKILQNDDIEIAITTYQIAEIMDLLRKQSMTIPKREIVFNLFKTDKFFITDINFETIEHCFHKSLVSNIHIYDYLVALPLKGVVTEIYSADDHFQHQDFKEIAPVINPLHPWILREGRIPSKA
jgi:predicted nucleic acid-binding protein